MSSANGDMQEVRSANQSGSFCSQKSADLEAYSIFLSKKNVRKK